MSSLFISANKDTLFPLLSQTNDLNVIEELYQIKIARTMSGKLIYPKTLGQREYYQALKHILNNLLSTHKLTFV